MQGKILRALAALIAVALAASLAACGGGGDATSTAEGPTTPRGVPLTPDGDNTIQYYGKEGNPAERRQAAGTLRAYVADRAANDWKAACRLMSKELLAELRGIASKSRTLENAPCSSVANLVAANLPRKSSKPPPDSATPKLVSFRVSGPNAIGIYTAAGSFYYMPFDLDGGAWKVSDLNGTALLEQS